MLSPRERKRRRLRERPFPDTWRRVLQATSLYRRIPPHDQAKLLGHAQVLLAEKRFEGAGGLTVDDAMKVLVAGHAAVLLLHRPPTCFPKLFSIVIYPQTYAVEEAVVDEARFVEEIDELRAGESWTRGAVVLSWSDVEADLEGAVRNVVLHEFAHQLDAEDGATNGAPILADQELRQRWARELTVAFDQLVAAVDSGHRPFIDAYGAQDPADFFAVATEAFFLHPVQLRQGRPSHHAILRDFYRQDPARW